MRTGLLLAAFLFSAKALAGPAAPVAADADAGGSRALRLDPFAPGATAACLQRRYDAAHIKRHPSQRTKEISVLAQGGAGYEEGAFSLIVRLRRDGDATVYATTAYCQPHSDETGALRLSCGVANCGAQESPVVFEPLAKGPARLSFGAVFSFAYGEEDAHREGPPDERAFDMKPDDIAFLLDRVPLQQCQSLSREKLD